MAHRALLCTVTFRILAVDRVEPPLIVGGIADVLHNGPYLPHECSGGILCRSESIVSCRVAAESGSAASARAVQRAHRRSQGESELGS